MMRINVTGEYILKVLHCSANGTSALPKPPHTGAVSTYSSARVLGLSLCF